jgi:hypothetical protein
MMIAAKVGRSGYDFGKLNQDSYRILDRSVIRHGLKRQNRRNPNGGCDTACRVPSCRYVRRNGVFGLGLFIARARLELCHRLLGRGVRYWPLADMGCCTANVCL